MKKLYLLLIYLVIVISTSMVKVNSVQADHVEQCSIVSDCPTGDAALGINFTGLQPADLSKGTFKVTASGTSSTTFSCTYPSGHATRTVSCNAFYNSSANNIECLIEHLDCRNNPFDITVSSPAGYSCSPDPSSVSLNNCSDNTPITVNCTPPSCTPDGSCSASTPACGQTTSGQDNCGNPCSKTGPACLVDGSSCTAISVNNGNAVTSGQSYPATVSMLNPSGNFTTWTTSAGYKLGSSNPRDNTVWGLNRVALPSTITPGNTAILNFNVIAPSVTAQTTKTFYWEMLREGVDWFGAQCQYNVTVNPQSPTLAVSCSASPTSTTTGTNVSWTALPAGGTSPYTYSWSGTDSLQGKTGNPATVSYTTVGTKTGSVRVTDSLGTQSPQTNCSNSVTITAPFDYSLSNSGNITVTQGSSGSNTVTATLSAGATQSVSFSASGLPTGATASWPSGSSCNPTCSKTLTISTLSSILTGTYPVTVTGTSAGVGNKTTSFNLIVNTPTGTLPATVDLKANGSNGPITISHNSSASLSWTTTNSPTACTASGAWSGSKSTTGGSQSTGTLSGPNTFTYSLTCSNSGGSNSDSVTINVSGPSGPICGNGVCEAGETSTSCPADCGAPPSSSNCAWIQTTGGDVHSNTGINTPCGP